MLLENNNKNLQSAPKSTESAPKNLSNFHEFTENLT